MLTLAYIDAGIVSKAVGKGNADVIQWLCETHNATINCRSGSGETPVYQAVYYGKDAVFDYLLEKDADVSVRENQSLIASVCSMQHAACSITVRTVGVHAGRQHSILFWQMRVHHTLHKRKPVGWDGCCALFVLTCSCALFVLTCGCALFVLTCGLSHCR